MKVETALDGSIRIDDRFVFLRRALLFCAALSIALVPVQISRAAAPARAPLVPRQRADDRGAAGQPARPRAVLVLMGFALACAGLAAFIEDSLFHFDVGSREIRWTKRRLFGRTRAGIIPFAEVADVKLRVQSSPSESRSIWSAQCQLVLVTRADSITLGNGTLYPRQALDVVSRLLALVGRRRRGSSAKRPAAG